MLGKLPLPSAGSDGCFLPSILARPPADVPYKEFQAFDEVKQALGVA